jgi:DNA-binding NtrC family response regulator
MHIIVPCYSSCHTKHSDIRQKEHGVQAFSCDRQSDPSLRVLLVEDDDAVRDELTEGLSLRGVDVVSATRPAEAMALLRRDECITVLVTDIRMPDGDGITLAEQVLRECDGARAVEVIVLTGHATLDTIAEADRLRISDLLRKPIRLASLLAAIEKAHGGTIRRRRAQSTAHAAALA